MIDESFFNDVDCNWEEFDYQKIIIKNSRDMKIGKILQTYSENKHTKNL